MSYFPDTVLYANEVNMHGDMPKQWQFDFLRHAIPKKKRFSKWTKKDPVTEDITAVQEYYKYSLAKAMDVISLLSDRELQIIKQNLNKGGKS